MSLCDRILEEAKKDLRQVEREMQRQIRMLDVHLQQLCEDLPVSSRCSPAQHPCCLCQPDPSPRERRSLVTRLDVEQELDSMQRRLNRTLNSSHDHKLLASMDVKGFDPKEVTVMVKDGKVKISAEHEEEHTTTRGKEYSYRKITKEINLPPGVREEEVTYSLGSNSIMKIETARKCCSCPLRH